MNDLGHRSTEALLITYSSTKNKQATVPPLGACEKHNVM